MKYSAQLPRKISHYNLLSSITNHGIKKPYNVGIYIDQKGEKFFVKVWQGSYKNLDAIALKHEAKMLSILHLLECNTQFSSKKRVVRVPQLVEFIDEGNRLILITEYIEGSLLRDCPIKQIFPTYQRCQEYLTTLYQSADESVRTKIGYRTWHYLVLYPYLVIYSFLYQKSVRKEILLGIPLFLRGILRIINTEKTFVHRDLHSHNIMVYQNSDILFDLARLTITHPMYEWLMTLFVEWENVPVKNAILHYCDTNWKNSLDQKLFRSLMVNCATHGLTGTNLPQKHQERFRSMLRYAVDQKNW